MFRVEDERMAFSRPKFGSLKKYKNLPHKCSEQQYIMYFHKMGKFRVSKNFYRLKTVHVSIFGTFFLYGTILVILFQAVKCHLRK